MTQFLILGALLVIGALGFVLWPFRRRSAVTAENGRRHDNLAIYQQRIAELEREAAVGGMTPEDLASLRDELAAALLDDVPRAQDGDLPFAAEARRQLWLPVLLACLLPVLTLVLYVRLGAGAEFELAGAAELLRSPIDRPAALADLVARLERRVSRHSDDADSLFLLGHARMRERNFAAAAQSFDRVISLRGSDPNTLVSLIQAQFLADGGRIAETNRARVDELLAHIPNQPVVLEMLAIDATATGDFARAAGYLQQALAGAGSAAQAAALRSELSRVRQLGGLGSGPAIDVTISGLAAIADVPADAVLYVLARRPGERLPRMVARTGLGADPLIVRLDGTTVMGEQPPLAEGEALEVVARLSRTGDVRPGSDTVEAISAPVTLAPRPVAVKLALSGDPPVAGPRVEERSDQALVTVALSAAAEVRAAPDTRVFVIARPTSGPPMPVAVRALTFADLPIDVRLSDQDAMAAGRTLGAFEEVAVLARLSRSGSPIRQPGDVETEVVRVAPAERPEIVLELR